jgi:hypothetical protein
MGKFRYSAENLKGKVEDKHEFMESFSADLMILMSAYKKRVTRQRKDRVRYAVFTGRHWSVGTYRYEAT